MNIVENIKTMRQERGLRQQDIADVLQIDLAAWNRIEKMKQNLMVCHLEKIASLFECRVIDLYTYPKRFVDPELLVNHERISVTFEISPDKRDFLLKLVTGNENIKLIDQ